MLEEEERRKRRRDEEGAGSRSAQPALLQRGEGVEGVRRARWGSAAKRRGRGASPFRMKTAFQMEMAGSAAALGTMAPFAPLPAGDKEMGKGVWGGGCRRSPSPRSPGLGPSEGPSPGGAPRRFAGCSRARRPGPAGHENWLEEC